MEQTSQDRFRAKLRQQLQGDDELFLYTWIVGYLLGSARRSTDPDLSTLATIIDEELSRDR